jgi:putative ABC transport system ATP-binding protein
VSEPLIRLRGITKVYGEGATALQALKGVNLDVEAGDFVAIMGPSGSGKSTAMNTLGGLDTPTTGEYLFKGAHVESLTRDQRARLRRQYFGFVFQGFNLLARTSAQENVELPLLYRGESASARHAAAAKALESVGLKGWEHHTGSSSASRLRVPSSPSPRCCWPMSRPATWTRSAAARSCNCYGA